MDRFRSDKLAHLSDEQIEDLLNKYYQKANISKLIKEYHINVTSHKFASILPFEEKQTDDVCECCGGRLILKYLSRNLLQTYKYICTNCSHSSNDEDCSCEYCQEKRHQMELLEKEKREFDEHQKELFVRSLLEIHEDDAVDFDALTFVQKVYLGAFLREGISEDYSYIKAIRNFTNLIAPTSEFRDEIIIELKTKRIIKIHPNVELRYIHDVNIEKEQFMFDVYDVSWYLNLKSSILDRVSLIDSIINPDLEFNKDDAVMLWRKIALHESIQYLQYNIMKLFSIYYTVGEKTVSVINDLLNNYSVSQIYYIIYNSTSKALRYKEEHNISSKHAANSIITQMQSLGERALNKGWSLEKYSRHRDCPQSLISKFFFERILKIDENGFNLKPSL